MCMIVLLLAILKVISYDIVNRIKCHTKTQTVFVHIYYILKLSNVIQTMCIYSHPFTILIKYLMGYVFFYIGLQIERVGSQLTSLINLKIFDYLP